MLGRLSTLIGLGLVLLVGASCGPAAAIPAGGAPAQSTAETGDSDGSSFANSLSDAYGLSDIQTASVGQAPAVSGSSKPWLYLTISSITPAGWQSPEGTRAMWQAALLAYAYKSKASTSDAPAVQGVVFVPAGDQTCVSPAPMDCDAQAMSMDRVLPQDSSTWSNDQAAISSSIAKRVDAMDNAKLVSVKFDKGVYATLPDITVMTDNPEAFANEYHYGTPAVVGDDSQYEGYILTVVDSNGDPVTVQAGYRGLMMGLGWSRDDVRSIIQATA
jgi:hypothetical protein